MESQRKPIDVLQFLDYREILRAEYEQRRSTRPRYSMRAFARDLDFNSSTLTEVLLRKKGLSVTAAKKFANHFKYTPEQEDYFVDLVVIQHSRSKSERERAKIKLRKHRLKDASDAGPLGMSDLFANWKALAFREYLELHPGPFDREKAKAIFDVNDLELETIITDLVKCGLVIEKGDVLDSTGKEIYFESPGSHPALKAYHNGLLDESKRHLNTKPLGERVIVASIGKFDQSRMQEAQNFIHGFIEKFHQQFGQTNEADSVMAFQLNFFRLDSPTES